MKAGLIVTKGLGLVFVYTSNKGKKSTSFGAPREKMHDEFNDQHYTLFGVFLYDQKKLDARASAKFGSKWQIQPYGDEFGDIGTPEGSYLKRETKYVHGEYVKTGGVLIAKNVRGSGSFIQRRREEYKRKLRTIHNKMKELMELGVERVAAIKAAKKCACKH